MVLALTVLRSAYILQRLDAWLRYYRYVQLDNCLYDCVTLLHKRVCKSVDSKNAVNIQHSSNILVYSSKMIVKVILLFTPLTKYRTSNKVAYYSLCPTNTLYAKLIRIQSAHASPLLS